MKTVTAAMSRQQQLSMHSSPLPSEQKQQSRSSGLRSGRRSHHQHHGSSTTSTTTSSRSNNGTVSNGQRDRSILSRSMAQAAAAAAATIQPTESIDQQESYNSGSTGTNTHGNNRRRNMSFMKYSSSVNEQKRTSSSMHRTREHAKQIAMAISKEDMTTTNSSTNDWNPQSNNNNNSNSMMPFDTDFHSAFGGTRDDDDDVDLFANFQEPPTKTTQRNNKSKTVSAAVPSKRHHQSRYPQQQQRSNIINDTSERSATTTESTTHSHDHPFTMNDRNDDDDFMLFPPSHNNNNADNDDDFFSPASFGKHKQQAAQISSGTNGSGSRSRRNTMIRQQLNSARTTTTTTNTSGDVFDTTRAAVPATTTTTANDIVDWPATANHSSSSNSHHNDHSNYITSTSDTGVVRVSAMTASPVVRKKKTTANSTASSSASSTNNTTTVTKLIPRSSQQSVAVPLPLQEQYHQSPQQQQQQLLHSPIPLTNSTSISSSTSSSMGAAARRLMRQQMRTGSITTNSNTANIDPTKSNGIVTSNNNNNNGSKVTDHVANYSTTTSRPTANGIVGQQRHRRNVPSEQPPDDGSSSSSVPQRHHHQQQQESVVVTKKKTNGFSFDAFGLDSDEMQREVNEAMNDLADSHPNITQFFAQNQKNDDMDDFVSFGGDGNSSSRWDDQQSNNSSSYNNNSGTLSTGTATVEEQQQQQQQPGFVDGFRVNKPLSSSMNHMPLQHVRESPTRSERSSLTNESIEHHGHNNNNATSSSINMFKQQANFHTSNKPRRVVRPYPSQQQELNGALPKPTFTLHPTVGKFQQQQQQKLQPVPKLDAHLAKTSALSPRGNGSKNNMMQQQQQHDHQSPRNIVQQPSVVEFFGEESSTDEEGYNSVVPNGMLHRHQQQQHGKEISYNDEPDMSDVGVASDVDLPSDVGVSSETGTVTHSVIGHLPFIDIREKEKKGSHPGRHTTSPSVRTESTAETTTVDDKKDDDFPVTSTVGSLRSQWETREQAVKRETKERLIQRQNVPSTISKEHIERLQNQLGDVILSPELLTSHLSSQPPECFEEPKLARPEESVQKQRSIECSDQRSSLSSVKERLKSTTTIRPSEDPTRRKSKSEGGAAIRHNSVNSILSNLQKNGLVVDSRLESPSASDPSKRRSVNTNGLPWSPARNNRKSLSRSSEAGFESQAMKLLRQQSDNMSSSSRRKTPTSPAITPKNASTIQSPSRATESDRNTTPRAGNNGRFNNVSADYDYSREESVRPRADHEYSREEFVRPSSKEQPQKQLTYRARRELELKGQRDEKEKRREKEHANEPEKKDVSALIRQRIAENKKNATVPRPATHTDNQQHLDISTLRTRLRPTPIETIVDKPVDTLQPATHYHQHNRQQANEEVTEEIDTDEIDTEEIIAENDDTANNQHDFHRSQSRSNGDEPEPVSLRSPIRSQRVTIPKASDLIIEDDVPRPPPSSGRVTANAAVSHMLMLQQLQQRQPDAPLSREGVDYAGQQSKESETKFLAISTDNEPAPDEQKIKTPKATMMMLNAFLAGRESLVVSDRQTVPQIQPSRSEEESSRRPTGDPISQSNNLCALKNDPKYARYFKMLSIGMPMEVVKHAMTRDGFDASVMDSDHNKPIGIPLKDDPTYTKYFRMFKIGLPMEAVKHAMERDGLNSAIMDQDHDLPMASGKQSDVEVPKEQDSHRRARLHWKTLYKVTSNSLWAQIDQDSDLNIEIDEEEFQELFQAEKDELGVTVAAASVSQKRGSSVCVIDSKRANNGGIILARLKMSHDDLADAVDRIDEQYLTGEQIENIIEYLPSKDERKALETYMLEGGQDAAEKFDGLCECEKFMVSMMTVKHAKRKVSALLFKLQFESCIKDIQKEACAIEQACEELSSSVRLRQLMGIVLTFGNRLNTAGNGKRKAGAFTLDSLLKLNQAKAFDKKTTFLHYIILIVQRNNELLLNFKDDLPTVFASEKIFWDQCVADLEEVENQLENVRKMALYQAHQAQSYRVRRKSKRDDPEESLSDADEALSLEEEVEALRSTPIGLFTLSAIKYVSALRDKVENTKLMFAQVLEYFGEEEKQLQPHELFSIIVSFSRDFDKAKEQVLSNERLKQREERKRQSTPGRPITNSPGMSNKKLIMKASNMQPNMTAILDDLKTNGRRIADNAATSTMLQRTAGNQEVNNRNKSNQYVPSSPPSQQRSERYIDHSEPQPPQQRSERYPDYSEQQNVMDRRHEVMQETAKRQYIQDSNERSAPIASYIPEPQKIESSQKRQYIVDTNDHKIESHPASRKPLVNGQSKSANGVESAQSFASDDFNYPDDNASQVTTETVNSSASTSSIAMRAKARMRRQRTEQRQLPSIPAMSPIGTGTISSAPSPRTVHDTSIDDHPERIPSPRSCQGDSAQPLSPRSNIRMKRRAEYRNKGRRSSNTTNNVQL